MRRAIWPLPKDTRLCAKDILQLLRCRRNQYVHSGKSMDAGEPIAYLMKSFIDHHLLILISNTLGVRTLEEYGKFLSLPPDTGALLEEKRKLAKAIRILGGSRHES